MSDVTPPTNRLFAKASLPGWMLWQPSWSRRDWIAVLRADDLNLTVQDWNGWAGRAQSAPEGDWATWLFLGGRGAGKTRAGAEWLTLRARPGARLALVGPTLHDVREVMIEGPSGLRAIAPKERRPEYQSSRRRLVWPNGAEAFAFSAEDSESLRGPQFHAAWADEFCAWRDAAEVLAMLRLGLRLGDDPRLVVTTSPKPTPALKALMVEPATVLTRAPTQDNAHNLAGGFLAGLRALYGGARLEAQELDGQVLDDGDGLWTQEMLSGCRGAAPDRCDMIVVGLDPPVTTHGDACGIVVVGRRDDTAYVLADRSVKRQSPMGWARLVVAAAVEFEADRIVAETNQGGEMVETMLRMAGCQTPVQSVHATQSKRVRAEPAAALYEQGRVFHCGAFTALEEEMMALGRPDPGSPTGGGSGRRGPSPDRADALVWAINHLMIRPRGGPRLRVL